MNGKPHGARTKMPPAVNGRKPPIKQPPDSEFDDDEGEEDYEDDEDDEEYEEEDEEDEEDDADDDEDVRPVRGRRPAAPPARGNARRPAKPNGREGFFNLGSSLTVTGVFSVPRSQTVFCYTHD